MPVSKGAAMRKPKTLAEVIRHFADENNCIDAVVKMRWPDGVSCPACGHRGHWYLAKQRRWKCKECWKQFSCKVGTVFEDSAVLLDKWLIAMWLLANCKNGISSYELARAIGVTQKSAWFMLHRIRLALQQGSLTKLGGEGMPVEVDETFIGGRARNMHKARKLRYLQKRNLVPDHKSDVPAHYWGKTVVMGMLERGGKVKAQVIPERRRPIVQQIVRESVVPGSEIMTDEFPGYAGLSDKYVHQIINHLDGYVREHVSTNGIENFWSLLKRGLGGTYVAVEPFHLFRYVDEQAFRFNARKDASGKKLNDSQRFELALSQIAGKRLTFAEVTGKVGQASN